MAENDNKSIRLMKSEISTLTPLEKEVIGSIVRGHGNLPDKMEGEEYDKLLQEVVDAEVRMMKRQPLSDRQREILLEESKCFDNGIEGLAKEMHVDADFLKASLGEHKYKPYAITIGTDNRPGGVEGEYHLQFKPDIMNVTFCEQEEVAKEFGGTMRVTNGQEWADFYHEADAVKFAEKVIDMNQMRDLVGRYQSAGMGNGTQFWPERGTLGIYQAFAFKNNNILVFKDANDNEGIRLSSLSHEEQKRVMDAIDTLLDKHITSKELADAKAKLVKVLDSARADLGDTILIQPTTVKLAGIDTTVKAIFLAPDGKGDGEFRLAGEDYAVLAVGEGKHTEFNIEIILEDTESIAALTAAVKEAHKHRPRIKTRQDLPEPDIRSAEYAAKQAVHDRIVIPSARSFTQQQLDALEHYRAMFTADTPAGELFTRLYEDVVKDPDVARKPEKWKTDTLKELNDFDFADGIIRDQARGIHI